PVSFWIYQFRLGSALDSRRNPPMLKPTSLINCLVVILLWAFSLSAQTGTSNITGTVRDTNGAVVAGASVTAKNDATGVTSAQVTTDSGVYAFSSLPVGKYTITVEKQGFKTLQKTDNVLEVGTPLTVDVALEVGQVSETVNVQGGLEQLRSEEHTSELQSRFDLVCRLLLE